VLARIEAMPSPLRPAHVSGCRCERVREHFANAPFCGNGAAQLTSRFDRRINVGRMAALNQFLSRHATATGSADRLRQPSKA